MNSSEILFGLNEPQIQAVTHTLNVPAMVLAGAGSGKTRVLTTRVAWLISRHDVRPNSILLVTFTNKASKEMTQRVERLSGVVLPFSGTFHRLCVRILRTYAPKVGRTSSFTIYDEDDQEALMVKIMKDLGIPIKETKPRVVLSMISSAKNELTTPEQYTQMAHGKYQELVARLYPLYQRRLEQNDAVDFDDLILKVIELLTNYPEIREYYRQAFQHVLIDEYQDTNTAQYALTKLFIGPTENLFVVGDFSQAIYGWRGADYRNMLTLTKDFPAIVTHRLEQNYRSTQSILDAASAVIANNTSHPVLELWTEKVSDEKIHIFEASSDIEEVSYVITQIQKYHDSYPYNDIAVLYRTNAQSRAFEEALIRHGIPYTLVGGVRFYARKEIKDLLSYLRLAVSDHDEVAASRIEKLGKRKYAHFLEWIELHNSKETGKNDAGEHPALALLDSILQATGYLEQFDQKDEDDIARLENIQELRSVAGQFSSVSELLETVTLVEQESLPRGGIEQSQEAVTLMSVHAAKGLEFTVVFIVGMEEGLFPHSRSFLDRMQMEEERRLCYVALTRAKMHLHITYARRRMSYGTVKGAIVSRFISEIPDSVIERRGSDLDRGYQKLTYTTKSQPPAGPRFVPIDDPSIDDFLDGNMDVDTFLNS